MILKTPKLGLKIIFIGLPLIVFSLFSSSLKHAFAQQDINVNAFVASKASVSKSIITVSPSEILANNAAEATLTVTVNDASGNPLSNLRVQPSSNRGAIDTITPSEANSNIVGQASFTIKSSTAGRATLSAFVDNTVTLTDKATLTFTRSTTETPVAITVPIPPVFGLPESKITLFRSGQQGNNELVNEGTEVQVPFVVFVLTSVFAASQPILLFIVIFQTVAYKRRDRKILKQQKQIIEQEKNIAKKIDENNTLPDIKLK